MEKKQNIKCDVETCKYQNCEKGECELDEIKVSCNRDCSTNEVSDKEETTCASFQYDKEKENEDTTE